MKNVNSIFNINKNLLRVHCENTSCLGTGLGSIGAVLYLAGIFCITCGITHTSVKRKVLLF